MRKKIVPNNQQINTFEKFLTHRFEIDQNVAFYGRPEA